MTLFRVWTPRAKTVDLLTGGRRSAMTAEHRGWFVLEMAGTPPETDYAFSLDGHEPLPDPRSRHQPRGVHAASRLLDHAAAPAIHSKVAVERKLRPCSHWRAIGPTYVDS